MPARFIAIVLGLALSASAVARAQREFRRTSNGDWQTTVVHADGTKSVFVFSPTDKFIATVESHAVIAKVGARTVRYRYVVANNARSVQGITSFLIGIGSSQNGLILDNTTVPRGWDHRLFGTVDSRIKPGERAVFSGESKAYPGALDIELSAHLDMNADYPEDMTERQLDEFSILRGSAVHLKGIGPKFPAWTVTGIPDVVEIARDYLKEFRDSRHPAASQLEHALAGVSGKKAEEVLDAFQAAVSPASGNPWHRSLSEAFLVCIELARAALQSQ